MYQGLFYLTLGALSVVSLMFVLRILGTEKNKSVESKKIDSWVGMEELEIIDIISRTHDIKTFRLKRKDGLLFDSFLPGQFISFQIGDDAKTLRSYSISSSIYNLNVIDVSIKLLEGGVGSAWFHARSIGDTVMAHPPSGLFTYNNEDNSSLVFVAGGIGITPFMSMIRTLLDEGVKRKIDLFYGMKTLKDMAYHSELIELSSTYDNFNYHPIVSNDEEYEGDKGFVSLDFIKKSISSIKDSKYYFCGPAIMTDTIMDALTNEGVLSKNLHSEKFASSIDKSNLESTNAKVNINGKSYDYDGSNTLLEFMEEHDLDPKFACRVGVCGSCKCLLNSGDVDQETDAGLGDDEKEKYILTCVARPKNDVDISI
ncbi:MAG: iron-sulfur cluster-binding domain-containing protein [Bacteriovoracaceae bacterium]|jgi:ferredoxin-NADP reductase|nr:iron-sulfur cluster-binding domain-containing protein [Bacteriovoracaceae bacterium]